MNIAIIIAGGNGTRTKQNIPKQFLNVYDKPIVMYTLEAFQKHTQIDAIEVVCLDGWQKMLQAYAEQFGITKLRWVVEGGNTSQESIRNGVYYLKGHCHAEDVILIHDGIRPMVDQKVITDCIEKCKKYGNGITALPVTEQIFEVTDEETSKSYISRDKLKILQTPQAYHFDKLVWAYEKAFQEKVGIGGSSYANTLMVDLGEKIYFAEGSSKNIKITTRDDIEIFKAMLAVQKDEWLKE